MGATIIEVGNEKAVKKYSAFLRLIRPVSYWSRKFMGEGENASMPLQLTDLENTAGDLISFDLSMQLKMQPV